MYLQFAAMDHAANPGRLRHKMTPGENGILVVVFSQVRVPEGKFGLERLFAGTRHNCLFLNDIGNGWYVNLDQDIDAAIDRAIAEVRPQRVIYYGSSMGGYGALTTGLRRRDGEIHAFGPELTPGRPGFQSADYGIPSDRHDVRHCDTTPCQHLHLYFGCFDPVDASGAAAAARLFPNASLHLVKSSHASHDHLYSLNIIRKIIRTFDRDPDTELQARELLIPQSIESLRRFASLGEALACGKPVKAEAVEALQGYDRNPGMIRLAAQVAAVSGDLSRAMEMASSAERLVEADPVLRTLPKRWRKELPLLRVRWLIDLNQIDQARRVLLETCERFPVDGAMGDLCRTLEIAIPNPGPSIG